MATILALGIGTTKGKGQAYIKQHNSCHSQTHDNLCSASQFSNILSREKEGVRVGKSGKEHLCGLSQLALKSIPLPMPCAYIFH